MKMDPTPDDLQNVAESLELGGVLDEVRAEHRKGLARDTEWSTPRYTHVCEIVRAFVMGVLSADPWYKGYRLPADFEGVVNLIAFKVQKEYGEEDVVMLSLLELEEKLTRWAEEHPAYLKWNEPEEPGVIIRVVTRNSPTPDHRDFIDLGALIRNAAVYLRNERRRWDASEVEFEARHKDHEAHMGALQDPPRNGP